MPMPICKLNEASRKRGTTFLSEHQIFRPSVLKFSSAKQQKEGEIVENMCAELLRIEFEISEH